jgi:hypothetical protein
MRVVSHQRHTGHATSHLDDDGVNGGLHACEQGRGSDDSAHIDRDNTRGFPRCVVGVGKSLGWFAENQGQGVFGGVW